MSEPKLSWEAFTLIITEVLTIWQMCIDTDREVLSNQRRSLKKSLWGCSHAHWYHELNANRAGAAFMSKITRWLSLHIIHSMLFTIMKVNWTGNCFTSLTSSQSFPSEAGQEFNQFLQTFRHLQQISLQNAHQLLRYFTELQRCRPQESKVRGWKRVNKETECWDIFSLEQSVELALLHYNSWSPGAS